MHLSASFTVKIGLVFVLTLGNAKRKSIGSCENESISGIFEGFQYFKFEKDFLENENIFQNTRVLVLDESTKIENASVPYKTTISEDTVKTNRMASTKWTYQKERSFVSDYFIFLEILFRFKNLI